MSLYRFYHFFARGGFGCAVLVLTGIACAPSQPHFNDGPAVVRVEDNKNIPEPKEHEFYRSSHHFDNFLPRQARLRLNPVPPPPAQDVNRFGQVPNSSWYVNRIEHVSPLEVAQGSGGDDPGPEAFKPWTITGLKVGGRNPGFVFEDTRGVRYICKFDKMRFPAVTTAAGAVAARLFWTCGYNVPDDRVVFFHREDLLIGKDATYRKSFGRKKPLCTELVDEFFDEKIRPGRDGQYRALISRYLPGRPVGGYSYNGTRSDDANDTIPHQNRRSLRGLRVFAAWLNHVDVKVDNTLDLYVKKDEGGFLDHYLVDFDGCLGGYWAARTEARIGFAYDFDLKEFLGGIPALGLFKRPYEDLTQPENPLVGMFESRVYDPARWKANYLNDQLASCTAADCFWAGTVLAQLSGEHIKAAVTAARFEDEEAADILTRVLIERREKTLNWALSQVTPVIDVDRIRFDDEGMHVDADDALRSAGLPSTMTYNYDVLDMNGNVLQGTAEYISSPIASVSSTILNERKYFIIRWTARDGTKQILPPAEAHYSSRSGSWRLVGVLRDGQ
jgi:hypothetical protein